MSYLVHLIVCLVLYCLLFVLTKRFIRKPIKTSLGNFSSFSGHIALCFCQLLSCFSIDSKKSLAVAIYGQIISRHFQDLVKI